MSKIHRVKKKGKSKRSDSSKAVGLAEYEGLELDSKIELIQELIPLGLMHIADALQAEVKSLAGEKHKRNGKAGHDRWGKQRGYVYVGDQRLQVEVPRVRNTAKGQEVKLDSYGRFQQPRKLDEGLFKRVLHGLSCRNYRECAEALPEAFSLSPSTVSRRFIRASSRKLKQLQERRLDGYDFVALVMDGKRFGDDGMIIAVGITLEGKKVVLGIVQAASENAGVCSDFLRELVERGLRYDKGLLCLIDGAKGLRKAVDEVFGKRGVVQRCQWHKRTNIVDYLAKGKKEQFRKKLQAAYDKESYQEARAALMRVRKELKLINESAAKSLDEGFEETLTLHRLGLAHELKRSFRTTNMIESIMAQVGQKTDKVDYWKNSNQKHRWVGSALLFIEQRLNRVNGYRYLKQLRDALQREINQNKEKKVIAA